MILFGDAEYILNGVWFTLLGWILLTANRMELEQALFSDRYHGTPMHVCLPLHLLHTYIAKKTMHTML